MTTRLFAFLLFLSFALCATAQPVPPPATQAEVDAGVNRFKYVTPYTLANSPLAGGPTNGVTAATTTNIANAAASTKQHGTSGLTNLSIAYTTNVFVYTTDNLPSVISNAANGTRLLLMPGSHQITSRFIFSNSLGQAGVNLFNKTNIQIEAAIPGTARIFTTNIGDMFFITNSARIAIRNLEIEGWVVTNYASTTLYSEPGVVWGAINLYDVADFELSGCRLINHHDHGLQGTGANINWNGASTNRILVFNNYFANIGSARTNAGISIDGTAVVPDGPWEIYNNTFEACLRAIEPYSDNDSSVRPWSGTRIQGNTFKNIIDSAILSAGSTNANDVLIEGNVFTRDVGYTRRGTNFITSSAAVDFNGGSGWRIVDNIFTGEWSRGVYLSAGSRYAEVVNNSFIGITNSGASTGVPIDAQVSYYARIDGNSIRDAEGQSIYAYGLRDSVIRNNNIYQSAAGYGIQIATFGGQVASNLTVADNRFIGVTTPIYDQALSGSKSLRFYGNESTGNGGTVYSLASTALADYQIATWDSTGGTNQVARKADVKNLLAAGANITLTSDSSGVTTIAASGSGSQTPWAQTVNGAGYSLTNVASVVINGASSTPGYAILAGTNGNSVMLEAANSNSVPVTNIVGLLHKAYASVVVLDCNDGNNFRFTNRAASANTTLVLTNLAQGQTISISMLGEAASGGTSRTVTIVPQLGYLVGDLDAFGTALALNKTVTLTNGNGLEISAMAKWEIGTNFCDIVTRQYQR